MVKQGIIYDLFYNLHSEAFVYLWINLLTRKYYIGRHKGNIYDGYIGSGPTFQEEFGIHLLNRGYLKKGCKIPENWIRFILFRGTNDEVWDKEGEEVTWETVDDPLCLNKVPGGRGFGDDWAPSRNWLDTWITHPIHGDIEICENYRSDHLQRDYLNNIKPSTVGPNISGILCGNNYDYEGWKLKNKKLRMQVKAKLSKNHKYGYFTNGNIYYLISDFTNFYRQLIDPNNLTGGFQFKEVLKGMKKTVRSKINNDIWRPVTKKEWKANGGTVWKP